MSMIDDEHVGASGQIDTTSRTANQKRLPASTISSRTSDVDLREFNALASLKSCHVCVR